MNKLKELRNKLSYNVEFDADDNIYVARCTEIPSLSAHGKTQEEALKGIKVVILETLKWIEEEKKNDIKGEKSSGRAFQKQYENISFGSDLESIEDFKIYTEVLAFLSSQTFQKKVKSDKEARALDKAISYLTNRLNKYAQSKKDDSVQLKNDPAIALSYLIKYNNVTEEELVNYLEVSYVQYREIIKGQRNISKAVARKLGQYFKVDPKTFIKNNKG